MILDADLVLSFLLHCLIILKVVFSYLYLFIPKKELLRKDHAMESARFILDVHLGKLAKLLRMMGFDTLYRNNLEDDEIIRIADQENRIVLTRDRGILNNKRVERGHFVESIFAREQITEVIDAFALKDSLSFLSRCMVCNGLIMEVSKEEVDHELKPRTRRYFNRFFRCRHCGKVYWEGSHYDRMKSFYEEIKNRKPEHE
ncbi:MAG: Mut7-C RNAse domain-containing protein [Bacteroidales bacterium]